MLLMCVVTVLDLHASARRETQRTAALTISVNDLRTQDASTVPDNSGHGVADRRVALSDAAAHATVNTTRSALRPAKKLRAYSRQQVQELIRRHASAHGVDPDLPLAIAQCESGFRWDASNRTSSARGVFQYLKGTWRSTSEGRKGTSVLDTDAHIRMAVKQIATMGTSPWNASRRCWAETLSEAESPNVHPIEPAVQDVVPAEPETQDVLNATE